jgi:predicted GTPase
MPNYSEQISKIEEKLEQQRQRLRDLRAQETKQIRKDETRRKILYGAAVLAMVDKMSEEKRRLALSRIEEHICRPKDRAFLGLPPLEGAAVHPG